MKTRLETKFFAMMASITICLVAAMVLGLLFVAAQIDQSSERRIETVVEKGFVAHTKEIARLVVPYTNWDDAVTNLDLAFNQQWADPNVGGFLGGTDRFEASIALNGRDEVTYGWLGGHTEGLGWDGAEAPAAALSPFVKAASGAIRRVRAAEAKRGDLFGRPVVNGMLSPPIQATVLQMVNGQPFIVIASLIQPDLGKIMPSRRGAIVINARALDGDFLQNFADRYQLADLSFSPRPSPGFATTAISDSEGHRLGVLQWRSVRPGAAMLRSLMPPLLVGALFLVIVIATIWRKADRANRGLVASEARATHMASHDALTGLPNRVLFHDRLGLALENSRRHGGQVAVLCIDLDRFKEVNDSFGHQSGDELIREVARRLSGTCRAGETLARLGGDEFAVVQPRATPTSAARLAQRIQRTVNGPVELSAGRVFIGCSTGISVLGGEATEPWEVLRQADLALYQAKNLGKGCFRFFEPEMDAALRDRQSLEGDLREALADKTLTMVYQPQVNTKGAIVGLEALVRWNHPSRGAVSPGYFVPIAEACGLIDVLGFYTLRIAFKDSLRWPGLKVAVNLSASQLRAPDFIERLRGLVAESRVNPHNLELEITEGILLGDDVRTHSVLRSLRAMGFGLALDDFGTGYSSLSYLRRYPVSKIKIDRSFVANLGVEKEADAMVTAIVRLAKALGLDVIAEGVETQDQRTRLGAAGCGDVQGYLFGKPTTREHIDEIMQAAA